MPSQGFAGLIKAVISAIGSKRSQTNTGPKLPSLTPADIRKAIDKGAVNASLDWDRDEDVLDVKGW